MGTTLFKAFCAACVVLYANSATHGAQGRFSAYDETADGDKQIADALLVAAQQEKHVLLQFGANWCVPCRQLHDLFDENRAIHQTIASNFVVVLIDSNSRNDHLIDKFHARMNFGLPFLIVLDANGKYLTIKNSEELQRGTNYAPDKVLSFLRDWAPKPRRELVAQLVALFLDNEFNQPVDRNLPQFQPVREFEADAVPLLNGVLTNRTDTGVATNNRRERLRACAALGLLDADLWTNQPAAEKRLLASALVSAFTQRLDPTFGEDVPEFLAIRRIGPDAVPFLMDVIREQTNDAERRIQAYWALGGLRASPEIVVPFLAEQFNTNNELLAFAGDALIKYGAEARRAIPALTNAFHDPDFKLAWRTASVLAKVYPDDADLAPTMADWLKSADVVHRRVAARVLADLGAAAKPAASALAEGAQDPDQTVREYSLKALDQLNKAAAGHMP